MALVQYITQILMSVMMLIMVFINAAAGPGFRQAHKRAARFE
jgi:hypothetical protein